MATDAQLDQHRKYLWSVCYRMTGSAADADDLVQETFVCALNRPPATDRPVRPWLTTVAMNLARDLLRRRRRRAYPGPWLPSPVELDQELLREAERTGMQPQNPEARYDTLESLSYAFLIAAEALTPAQRAVLLLRDVLDYSVAESAAALQMTEGNVKVTLHRARKKMVGYDRTRRPPSAQTVNETREVLFRILVYLAAGDAGQVEQLLAADVRALTDGAGLPAFPKAPVTGRAKVARMYAKLSSFASAQASYEVHDFNGMPAIIGRDPGVRPPASSRFLVRIELDGEGRVREMHAILSPEKLDALLGGALATT